MNLIIASEADTASINLRDRLLEMSDWVESGSFDNNEMWTISKDYGDFCRKGTQLITIQELHIYAEEIDKKWQQQNNKEIENIIFLSRHKAASGRPSLTVHPIGNWGTADYGGKEAEVSGATPGWMTGLLLKIRENRIDGYDVCFEATHHGPFLQTPTMFLEIGSSESEWEKKEPVRALIKSLLELQHADGIKVIGIGGGHYTPRFTEAAFSHRVCFGHMVANYGVSVLTSTLIKKAINSSEAEGIYFHRKGMKKSEYRKWKLWAEENQIKIYNQTDYKKRNS